MYPTSFHISITNFTTTTIANINSPSKNQQNKINLKQKQNKQNREQNIKHKQRSLTCYAIKTWCPCYKISGLINPFPIFNDRYSACDLKLELKGSIYIYLVTVFFKIYTHSFNQNFQNYTAIR